MSRQLLMVGTEKGAFLIQSDKNREHWNLTGPLIKGWKVFDLQLDSRTQPTLFAAVGHFVYGPSIHISKDLGQTWQQMENGPAYSKESGFQLNNIWSVVPGRQEEPNVLYAGVDEAGLFISEDGGRHWREIESLSGHASRKEWQPGNGGLCCHTILLDPADRQRMWVGISAVGVFRTDDGGQTWQTKNSGVTQVLQTETHKDIGFCVHRMVLDKKNPNRLYQQNHMGVFRSANGGDSWEPIETGLPTTFGFPMVISPSDANTLFIIPLEKDEFRFSQGGHLSVYRSTNAGNSWQALNQGLPQSAYVSVLRQAMTVDDSGSGGIYFGTSGGQIYYSRNNGDAWRAMPFSLPRIYSLAAATLE